MAHRGRKRKLAPRIPGGRLSRAGLVRDVIVPPSPDLLRHRRSVTGQEDVGLDYPLDHLVAAGLLTQAQAAAGARFAALHWRLYGRPTPAGVGVYQSVQIDAGDTPPRRHLAIDDDEEASTRYSALRSAGRVAERAVVDVAIYLRPVPDQRRHVETLVALIQGLAALVSAWDRGFHCTSMEIVLGDEIDDRRAMRDRAWPRRRH